MFVFLANNFKYCEILMTSCASSFYITVDHNNQPNPCLKGIYFIGWDGKYLNLLVCDTFSNIRHGRALNTA